MRVSCSMNASISPRLSSSARSVLFRMTTFGKFNLFGQQVGDGPGVIFIRRLPDAVQILANAQIVQKIGGVNNRDHRVQFGNFRKRDTVADRKGERVGDRCWF